MPKRLFDNLGQSRNICHVKFTLREKLNLTNTPGLVQIIEKSFRYRNKASEVSQGQPNINEESIRLSYKLADLDEDRISQATQPALVINYLEVGIG